MTIQCGFCLTAQSINCQLWVPGIAGVMSITLHVTVTMGKHAKRLIAICHLTENSLDQYVCTAVLNHLLIWTITYLSEILCSTHMDRQSSMSKPRLDTRLLVEDPSLTSQYNIEVNNAFTALGKLTQDVEHAWEQV